MLVLCYPKCSTCKKAEKWLQEHAIDYTYRDIKQDHPERDEIKAWHERSGLEIKRFFNTSGNLYKQMNLKEKLPEMSLDEAYTLLATDGMLVKRPLLVCDDIVIPGFKEETWAKALKI